MLKFIFGHRIIGQLLYSKCIDDENKKFILFSTMSCRNPYNEEI